jgi:hemerythrin superfamily protein
MDAITFLIKQHRQIEQALEDALKAERPEQRTTAFKRVADDLGKHVVSEEQVFYPAVKARRTEDILLESLEEHLSLKRLLADLVELAPSADTWQPKLKVLDEQTRHHHEEEEENLFPRVRKICSELDLNALGDELQACQTGLVRAGEAHSAVIEKTDEAVPLK